MALEAPSPYSRTFRVLPSGWVSGISTLVSASLRTIERQAPACFNVFGPSSGSSGLLCPRLTSAEPSRRLSTPVARDPPRTGQIGRSPRVRCDPFPLMPAASTSRGSVQVLGFGSIGPLTRSGCLVCGFCSSGQRFAYGFLQIPPRGGHPCRSANSSPCRVCRGLSPLSIAPCLAHKHKKAPILAGSEPFTFCKETSLSSSNGRSWRSNASWRLPNFAIPTPLRERRPGWER